MFQFTKINVIYLFCFLFTGALNEDVCERCVPYNSCPQYVNMNRNEQQKWVEQFQCQQSDDVETSTIHGFSPVAKGDYVCCPSLNVWGVQNEDSERNTRSPFGQDYHQSTSLYDSSSGITPKTPNTYISPDQRNFNNPQQNTINWQYPNNPQIKDESTLNFGIPHQNVNNWQNPNNRRNDGATINIPQQNYPKEFPPGLNNNWNNFNNGRQSYNYPEQILNNQNKNIPNFNNKQNFNLNGHQFGIFDGPNNQFQANPLVTEYIKRNPNFLNQRGFNTNGNMRGFQPKNPIVGVVNPGNNNPFQTQGYFIPNHRKIIVPQHPNFGTGGSKNANNNSFGSANSDDQCKAIRTLPPDPDTGCCGLDMSTAEGVMDLENTVSQRVRNWLFVSNNMRRKRAANNDTVDIDFDNRIAGGTETELNQFPWTVLLQVTFDNGVNQTTFTCGGSIISSRYVLTAAHCVYEKGAVVSKLDIYLAEYDKRTFPKDCKLSFNGEQKCIENVLMYAEDVIHHPGYDNLRLYNDIALIKLRGYAPYTEYIRPICLPPINVDNPTFYGLPLPVAGWGRNGPYVTDVKQSTVISMVSHSECLKYYPYLSPSHLCAAGKTGEDTCKGDSGGPLMMLYGGRYYVIGIVSGKRADTPCGASVPSLYTNVFQYRDWIQSIIK